jgi:DNA-directed RNA polymerase specialized sigma24 family protein
MSARRNLTDLVPELLADREEAIAQFVDGALRPLIAYGMDRWNLERQDAEDLAMEAIEATLPHLPKLCLGHQADDDPVFGYLITAMKHGSQLRFRKLQQAAALLGHVGTDPAPGGPVEQLDERTERRGDLSGTPTPQVRVLQRERTFVGSGRF